VLEGATKLQFLMRCDLCVLDREEAEVSAKQLRDVEAGVDAVRGRYHAARVRCGGGEALSTEREAARLQAEHSQVRCCTCRMHAHACSLQR
jgi:hypothetical protein